MIDASLMKCGSNLQAIEPGTVYETASPPAKSPHSGFDLFSKANYNMGGRPCGV